MIKKMNFSQIGTRIKRIRTTHKMSTNDFAAMLELSVNAYRKYERGLNTPSHKALILLVKNLDISLDWLLLNKGPMYFSEIENAFKENKELKQVAAQKDDKQSETQKEQETIKTSSKEPEIPEDAMIVTAPEIKELIQYMEDNPLFKYQMLTHFYTYKQEGKNPFANPEGKAKKI
jgi:transcriptional regulator with XRE-family HTH domain